MAIAPVQDERRVAEIGRYRVLVEPPRPDLLALVEIAAQVALVPMATINLLTDTEQHQIATHGFDASVCRREDSMCATVLEEEAPVIVPDASKDPRFADNPFVTGAIGRVRFYATHQLRTPDGVVIGTLCVFDEQPRTLADEQESALVGLADRVVDLLELELRTRELQRSNEQLAAFAGQVSHDLRNPLTAVTMALRMLDDELDGDGDMGFLVQRAIGGADRMQSLIDDLLKFARVGGELQRGPVDLGGVLRDVVEDLAVPLTGATIVTGDLPTVTGDAVQLRAVLQNLVANAAKFTRAGRPPHIEVDSTVVNGRWRIEICDRGPGIPEDQRERVFQPLARIDEDVEGSGIGLSTCRRIIEAHGGRIGLGEAAYGGTCAWFELPEQS
ncbi:GAF domain-containing protein [Nocardioides sp. LMS-CY]|uniref:Sensor-like histidine kinase SenX3 n=1 Tax=Nocardioides soli TaxID=1036020 RepID=A0A7W4YYZ9_9ACTN|nr:MULTISPECIES: GAF domain-containing sensor histidine kinase [Nocardioides]MBB3040442.1 signal transduction histidine kinase [Nocardioides soli]QWF24080.1 GAF domain-containing protein [Nocardioides sp. LMS-CY]